MIARLSAGADVTRAVRRGVIATTTAACLLTRAAAALADGPSIGEPSVESRASSPIEERAIVVWPTLTPAGDVTSGALHRPTLDEGTTAARAAELDATLRDSVQDLGFSLDVADPGPSAGQTRDLDILERAASNGGLWLISPRLEPAGTDKFVLRLVLASPKSKELRVRTERVDGSNVAARALVLLRDLIATTPRLVTEPRVVPSESATLGIMSQPRSPGRATLAANAALFGAFMAFSVQRASGSTDPRVLYPLLTLGTGVGLGGALLVSDEWNISTGDAWTIAGGAWWGSAAGILIANGHGVPLTDRYAWGAGGGLVGLGLATFSLSRGHADEGEAALVHSSAGAGLGLGAVADWFTHGDIDRAPHGGAGYGAAIGLVTGGVLAKVIRVPASRVLLIDLGAGLGAVGGAAIGSPLVFEELTPERTRGFLAATSIGAIAGGAAAWWFTRESAPPVGQPRIARVLPWAGALPVSSVAATQAPSMGLGVRGQW